MLKAVNNFRKKIHLRCLTGFWRPLCEECMNLTQCMWKDLLVLIWRVMKSKGGWKFKILVEEAFEKIEVCHFNSQNRSFQIICFDYNFPMRFDEDHNITFSVARFLAHNSLKKLSDND